jgi:hypothetical protein
MIVRLFSPSGKVASIRPILWQRGGVLLLAGLLVAGVRAEEFPGPSMEVPRCEDFELDGTGHAAAWQRAPWTPLERRETEGLDYSARVKMLYSATGIYVLMEGTDRRLTATMTEDFENLWTEDVFEVFLWPDQRFPLYFEYEISPLGYELPILIPNLDGKFLGWRPWHYEGDRKTRKAVSIQGGPQRSGASIEGWRAETALR